MVFPIVLNKNTKMLCVQELVTHFIQQVTKKNIRQLLLGRTVVVDLILILLYLILLGSMVLSISVLDINDNAPEFEQTEYVTSLNETSPTGTYVLQVKCVCVCERMRERESEKKKHLSKKVEEIEEILILITTSYVMSYFELGSQ